MLPEIMEEKRSQQTPTGRNRRDMRLLRGRKTFFQHFGKRDIQDLPLFAERKNVLEEGGQERNSEIWRGITPTGSSIWISEIFESNSILRDLALA
jgi:hypothetical protein